MCRKENRLWEPYQSENTLRHVRVRDVITLRHLLPLLSIAHNAIALSYLTTFVLPAVAIMAEKLSRLKALNRRLAEEE